jgi:hypothetical protein
MTWTFMGQYQAFLIWNKPIDHWNLNNPWGGMQEHCYTVFRVPDQRWCIWRWSWLAQIWFQTDTGYMRTHEMVKMAHAIRWHVMGKISIPWMPWHGSTFYARHIGLHAYVDVTWMEMGVRLMRGPFWWCHAGMGCSFRKLFWWHHAAVAAISSWRIFHSLLLYIFGGRIGNM